MSDPIFPKDLTDLIERDTVSLGYRILAKNKDVGVIPAISRLIKLSPEDRFEKIGEILGDLEQKQEQEEFDDRIL